MMPKLLRNQTKAQLIVYIDQVEAELESEKRLHEKTMDQLIKSEQNVAELKRTVNSRNNKIRSLQLKLQESPLRRGIRRIQKLWH